MQFNQQLNSFYQDFIQAPVSQCCVILGERGMGKTTFMRNFGDLLNSNGRYITVELTSKNDLLQNLRDQLALPDSVSIHNYLGQLDNQQLVILVDDVKFSESMISLVDSFRDWHCDKLPVSLIMFATWLDFDKLSTTDPVTFLLRSNQVFLRPIPAQVIKDDYLMLVHDNDLAKELTLMPRGYPLATQALRSLISNWLDNHDSSELHNLITDTIPAYKSQLFATYQQIWDKLDNQHQSALFDMLINHADVQGWSLGELQRDGLIYSVVNRQFERTLPYFLDFLRTTKQ